jgi:metal-responsive CopG/Arc/MetJ family transcriptional regulator
MTRTTETMTVSLPPAMMELVDRTCEAEHRTRSELVREALRLYFAQAGQPVQTGGAKSRRPRSRKQ